MQGGELMTARIPVMIHLDGETFRQLERVAQRKDTTMRALVERAIVVGLAQGTPSARRDRGRRLTAQQREAIASLYESGVTAAEIARRLECSYHGVRYQLRKAGLL